MRYITLNSLGIRAYRNLNKSFLARWIYSNPFFIAHTGLGQRHSVGRLWKREGGADCTMGVAAGLDFMNARLKNIVITAVANIELFSLVHDHLLGVGTVFVLIFK